MEKEEKERKLRPPQGSPPEDAVHLPTIAGVRPGVYLALLYTVILLTALFLLLLYPGLVKRGSVLVVQSEPQGAAVQVDGVYQGTTPCEIFVPQGNHGVMMSLPGFAEYRTDLAIQSRLVGSLFFPRKERLKGTLQELSPASALRAAAAEYGAWSFTGEPTASYQIPQSLSEGVYRSGLGGADPTAYEEMDRILRGASRFAATKAGLRDLIRAKYLLDNCGLASSPVSVLRSLEAIGSYLAETPGSGLWLASLLPAEAAQALKQQPWYTKQAKAAAERPLGSRFEGPASGGGLTVQGVRFRAIPSGTLVPGVELFPGERSMEAFHIAETEAPLASWEVFVAEEPSWNKENTQALKEQGLVTEDYLLSLDRPASERPGGASVPGVSWYAAAAYCRWLTAALPPEWADYEVRLPREVEWEYAAWAAEEAGLRDMIGGHWEWCADPYAPFPFLAADPQGAEEIGSPERSLRGGAWINPDDSVDPATRGSLPPAFCSAFVSFRPVLVRRAEGSYE
jgi:hypothetical protein